MASEPGSAPRPVRPDPRKSKAALAERQIRLSRILGLAFAIAGFAAIGVAWYGMAKVACVDCQLPYLLSGGAAGLGLILFGVGLLLMAQIRTERIRLNDRLEALVTTLARSTRGTGEPASARDGEVVAGRSTYHRPDCKLIVGKTDLDVVSVEAATLQGLSPCRVCHPEAPNGAVTADTKVLAEQEREAGPESVRTGSESSPDPAGAAPAEAEAATEAMPEVQPGRRRRRRWRQREQAAAEADSQQDVETTTLEPVDAEQAEQGSSDQAGAPR
jgi:hypothetical protein